MFGEFAPRLRSLVATALGKAPGSGANAVVYLDANLNPAVSANLTYDGSTVKTRAGGAANQQEWGNSGGTALSYVNFAGIFQMPSLTLLGATPIFEISPSGNKITRNATNGQAKFVCQNFSGAGWLFDNSAGHVATTPLLVLGAASQAGPLVKLQGTSSTAAARDVGFLDAGLATATDASYKGFVQLVAQDFNFATNAGGRVGVRVESDGTQAMVGFFGGTPVARQAAIADTSGATLAALEAEVNKLKLLLRNYNLLTP